MATAREIIAKLNAETPDPWVGYASGLNDVMQTKHYHQLNFALCINQARNGVFNHGIVPSEYVLQYLKQESDFDSWYEPLSKRTYLIARVGNGKTCINV